MTYLKGVKGGFPARLGKYRLTHRLTFPTPQVAVAKRRCRIRTNKKEAKNYREAIRGMAHQEKRPFPTGKLPMQGAFRVTCMIIASVTTANVRHIHHCQLQKQKEENRENGAGDNPEMETLNSHFKTENRSPLLDAQTSEEIQSPCV